MRHDVDSVVVLPARPGQQLLVHLTRRKWPQFAVGRFLVQKCAISKLLRTLSLQGLNDDFDRSNDH